MEPTSHSPPNYGIVWPQHSLLSKPKLGQSAGKLASKLLDLGGDELVEPTSHASYLNIVLTALLLP